LIIKEKWGNYFKMAKTKLFRQKFLVDENLVDLEVRKAMAQMYASSPYLKKSRKTELIKKILKAEVLI